MAAAAVRFKVKVKGQMRFLVNASPPKPFNVATSYDHIMKRIMNIGLCDQGPRSRTNNVFSCNAYFG